MGSECFYSHDNIPASEWLTVLVIKLFICVFLKVLINSIDSTWTKITYACLIVTKIISRCFYSVFYYSCVATTCCELGFCFGCSTLFKCSVQYGTHLTFCDFSQLHGQASSHLRTLSGPWPWRAKPNLLSNPVSLLGEGWDTGALWNIDNTDTQTDKQTGQSQGTVNQCSVIIAKMSEL